MKGTANIKLTDLDELRAIEEKYFDLVESKKVATVYYYAEEDECTIELHDNCDHLYKVMESAHKKEVDRLNKEIAELSQTSASYFKAL